jgi:hypothetical protein
VTLIDKIINKRALLFLGIIAILVPLGLVLGIFIIGFSYERSIEEIAGAILIALDVKYYSFNFILILAYLFLGDRILKVNHIILSTLVAAMVISNLYMISRNFISIFNTLFWAAFLVYLLNFEYTESS